MAPPGRLALGPRRVFFFEEGICDALLWNGGAAGGVPDVSPSSEWFVFCVRAAGGMFDSALLRSSSSTPKDNLPFASCFRFFFGGGPWGVLTLCFDHQSLRCLNADRYLHYQDKTSKLTRR